MPKTIRNKFDKELTYKNLLQAHKKSEKGKTCKKDVIKFNLKQEDYLNWLYIQLKTLKYKHGGYNIFYVTEPKLRKIESSRYMDRIVHTWYIETFINPFFLPQFVTTTYACIKGRGMHKSAKDVQKAMLKAKNKWGEYYIIKFDVKKFFANINKEKLLKILFKKIKDEKLWWLTKEIIYSNSETVGIPIGNYTSQIFANIYLNELDQYVKHNLQVKYFFRYMDDFIIFTKTKQEAKQTLEQVKAFLQNELFLELNSKTNIFKDKQGVNFCGYKININRIKVRDKGKRKLKKKIKELKYKIKNKEITSKEAKKYLSGHIGYIKHADIYNLKNKLFEIE